MMGCIKRNLDGCYFRVQRDGKYQSICFSDLTEDERTKLFDKADKSAEWWKSLAYHLADCLRNVGEHFDILRE